MGMEPLSRAVLDLCMMLQARLGRLVRLDAVDRVKLDWLAGRYRLPGVFREFLRRGSSVDFGAGSADLAVGGLGCFLPTADGFEASHLCYADQPGWPPAWIVCALEADGCYVLDTAKMRDEDCPVLHLSHGDGLKARPVAPSFVAFLERIVAESPHQPDLRAGLDEAGYEMVTDPAHIGAVAHLARRCELPGSYVQFLCRWTGAPGAHLAPVGDLDSLQERARRRFPDWRREWFAIAADEHDYVHFLWRGTRQDDDAQVWAIHERLQAPYRVDRSFVTYLLEV
jgi:SMI1 / KNR4 family (SUKH-1)